jgi:hypothetical protein
LCIVVLTDSLAELLIEVEFTDYVICERRDRDKERRRKGGGGWGVGGGSEVRERER